MSNLDLVWVALAAAALWVAIMVGRYLLAWRQIRRLRFATDNAQLADRAGMPPEVAEILATAAARLVALGFEYHASLRAEPFVLREGALPVWTDIYRHAATGSWAWVQPAEAPEAGMLTAVTFLTLFAERVLATENRRQHLLLPLPPDYQNDDALAASLAEHWAFHCRRLAGLPAPLDDANEFERRRAGMRAANLAWAREQGWILIAGDQWRLTVVGAWRMLRQMLAGSRRIARLPAMTDVDPPAAILQADMIGWHAQEAILRGHTTSLRDKVLWFAGSALVGVVAFAAMTSWTVVPVLVGVLLFHEFGHALAMRIVGYRNLSVLMLPFLGAVAIGRKDDAGPWQKLFVLLAGPVPGLLGAVLLLSVNGGVAQQSLAYEMAMIALWLNLFNLLPLMPLDGGQIVATFLFARQPYLRFVFQALSTVGLLGVALALRSIPLAAAGLLLLLTLPTIWRMQRLLASSRGMAGSDPMASLLSHLHHRPGQRPMAFAQRMQLLRALLPHLHGRVPTLVESAGGLVVYVAVLVLPIWALWHTGMPQDFSAQVTGPSAQARQGQRLMPNWDAQLAATDDPEQRWEILWQAGQWYHDADDEELALHYYHAAEEEAQRLPKSERNDLRRLDTRIAITRFGGELAAREALLPELRRLPAEERWRLADVLEDIANHLRWSRDAARPASVSKRIAYLREAIAAREPLPTSQRYPLFRDRSEWARLLDENGKVAEAEALLRMNLAELAPHQPRLAMGPVSDFAWFMATHQRAAEGEAAIRALGLAGEAQMASVLAWMLRSQGNFAGARQVLAEANAWFAGHANSGWTWQRMEILLDLISASADVPEEKTRWLDEALQGKVAWGSPSFKAFCRVINQQDDEPARREWQDARDTARREALQALSCPAVE